MPEDFPFDLLMLSSPSSPSPSPPPKRSRISAASGGLQQQQRLFKSVSADEVGSQDSNKLFKFDEL